jgi:hypothetical protein
MVDGPGRQISVKFPVKENLSPHDRAIVIGEYDRRKRGPGHPAVAKICRRARQTSRHDANRAAITCISVPIGS